MIRKEYRLTSEQKGKLLEAMKPVPYMVIGGQPPRSQQENANAAWKELGKELGFIWDTVRPIQGKTDDWFSAIETSSVAPKKDVGP